MTQLTGTGPQVIAQELFSDSSTQLHGLGELVHSSDGRAYRYCKAGSSALVVGNLQQSSVEDTGDQGLAIEVATVGSSSITTTSTVTVTANQYAGGFALVTVTPGVGYLYHISGHSSATAAVVTINLDDEIDVALTASSTIDLIKNPYDGVIVNPTTATASPVGVAVKALTASYYGWLQVAGPSCLLADGTVTVGTEVVASNAVAGAVEAGADATDLQAHVGTAITGIADTEYGAVRLELI